MDLAAVVEVAAEAAAEGVVVVAAAAAEGAGEVEPDRKPSQPQQHSQKKTKQISFCRCNNFPFPNRQDPSGVNSNCLCLLVMLSQET